MRCFEDEEIIHVDGFIDPIHDIEIIETELILADIQKIENRIKGVVKSSRGDKNLIQVVELLKRY